MKQEITQLRTASKPVVWMLQNHEALSREERDEIGSIAGTLRAWILQWDRREKATRTAQAG